jgi:hypothetical protein
VAGGATAQRKQEIAKRMVALTAELELMTLGWEESTAAELPRTFAPQCPAPDALAQEMAQKRDTRSFFRSNAEYGMLNDPALALPRGTGRPPPRHGRRAKVRHGLDVRYPTMHLSGSDGAGNLAASLPEETQHARDVSTRAHERLQRRDDVLKKAFQAGQNVVLGHAPNHHLEPTLGFEVPVRVEQIAPQRRAAQTSTGAQRHGTPLAGQTQFIRAHTPSVPAHSKYFGRSAAPETQYAEAVYRATGANPYAGRPGATRTARSGPI